MDVMVSGIGGGPRTFFSFSLFFSFPSPVACFSFIWTFCSFFFLVSIWVYMETSFFAFLHYGFALFHPKRTNCICMCARQKRRSTRYSHEPIYVLMTVILGMGIRAP
ncbi:hypothetical protein F5X96DRAFT_288538 [Biscogniauxia mediterranea]|nr:hypothetical protein F5X96DRAFT_288538 [Biscogniauxia mediterranea]